MLRQYRDSLEHLLVPHRRNNLCLPHDSLSDVSGQISDAPEPL